MYMIAPALKVPDARLPVLTGADTLAFPKQHTTRRKDQLHRRALVLAAARRHIGDSGHENLTLRAIATDCDLAVQTIFNLVGNRPQVIRDSITDLASVIDRLARSSNMHPIYPIAHADIIWHLARTNSACMRKLSIASVAIDVALPGAVKRHASGIMQRALVEMQDRLRPEADIRIVSSAISSAMATVMNEWALELFDLAELRRNLVSRVALLMMGAMVPAEAAKIGNYLDEFMGSRRK